LSLHLPQLGLFCESFCCVRVSLLSLVSRTHSGSSCVYRVLGLDVALTTMVMMTTTTIDRHDHRDNRTRRRQKIATTTFRGKSNDVLGTPVNVTLQCVALADVVCRIGSWGLDSRTEMSLSAAHTNIAVISLLLLPVVPLSGVESRRRARAPRLIPEGSPTALWTLRRRFATSPSSPRASSWNVVTYGCVARAPHVEGVIMFASMSTVGEIDAPHVDPSLPYSSWDMEYAITR